MPPVENLKALVSNVMTERTDKRGRNSVLAVFDVSRAHFYGVCERDAYVEPEHLSSNGFKLGASNPALYRSELVNGFCHGDDFVDCGSRRLH